MKKVAIIVGHDAKAQGARSYNGISEYVFNKNVGEYLKAHSLKEEKIDIRVFTKKGLDYSKICLEYLEWKPHISISLHFNSYVKVARGMECLVRVEDKQTYDVADLLTDYMSELMDITERHKAGKHDGIKIVKSGERGYTCLDEVTNYCKHVMLYEPCFGNTRNADSLKLFADGGKFYAECLFTSICKVLEIDKPVVIDDTAQKIKNLHARIEEIEERLNNAKVVI
jgi:hypothetical protein